MATTPAVSWEELAPATPAKPAESQATPEATPAATAPATPPAEPAKVEIPQFTEADAESLRQFSELGITPQNAREFIEAKQSLANLDQILRTNPDLFMDQIQRTDPKLHAELLERFSNRWWYQLPEEVKNGTAQPGSTSRTPGSAPSQNDSELASIKQTLNSLMQRFQMEDQSKAQEKITTGFNSSLDRLADKLPEGTSEKDKDYIRLKAQELIWKDEAARSRVAKGVYVDVPKYYAEAMKKASAETKAAANSERTKREDIEKNGTKQIIPAAEPAGGTPVASDRQEDPIWGNISTGEVNAAVARK